VQVYHEVLNAYAGKPVYMSILNIGGDKPLPYFSVTEENPALGWRGIRFCLDNSPLLMTQTRAMIRAADGQRHSRTQCLPGTAGRCLPPVARRGCAPAKTQSRDYGGSARRNFPIAILVGENRFYLHRLQRPQPISTGPGSQQRPRIIIPYQNGD